MDGETISSPRAERITIVVGLLTAVGAGMAAGMFESVTAQTLLYAASSLGWVVATAILALRHVESADWIVAAGFMILAVAEMLLWVGGRPGDLAYESAFAGGAMFYAPGLLMVGIPPVYGRIVRFFSLAAALVWALFTALYFTGSDVSSTGLLAIAGYVLVSGVFVGISVPILRRRRIVGIRSHDVGMAAGATHGVG
jgi:hypothetical protein